MITEQEALIDKVQALVSDCLNQNEFEAAIALGELLKNLTQSYKNLLSQGSVKPSVFKSSQVKPIIGALGMRLGDMPKAKQQYREGMPSYAAFVPELHQQPLKPTTYNWPDGFAGVELTSPNQDNDYWGDERRQ